MEKTEFIAYGVSTTAYPSLKNRPVDHVFVVTSEHNWPCFGRGGKEIPNSHVVAKGFGYAKWAEYINGPDPIHPTGLINKVTGVCHNVANRLLVLANADVSDAFGNEIVTLMYGKYGFYVDQYVERVKATAARVNEEIPGAITQNDIDSVVNRITNDIGDELESLVEDIEARSGIEISAAKKQGLGIIYTEFHKRREEVFAEVSRYQDHTINSCGIDAPPALAFQQRFQESMNSLLKNFLQEVINHFGLDTFVKVFKVNPDQAQLLLLL